MIIKRELKKDGTVCLYLAEESYNHEKKKGEIKKKKGEPKILKALGMEQPVQAQSFTEERAVVWAEGRTLGNVVPYHQRARSYGSASSRPHSQEPFWQ